MNGDKTKLASKLRRLKVVIKNWNEKSSENVDKKFDEIKRKILEWYDIGSSRKLNEVELKEVSQLNLEL